MSWLLAIQHSFCGAGEARPLGRSDRSAIKASIENLMKSTIKYYVWDRHLDWPTAIQGIKELVQRRGYNPIGKYNLHAIRVNAIKSLRLDSLDEFIQALQKLDAFDTLSSDIRCDPLVESDSNHPSTFLAIQLDVEDKVTISVEARDYDLIEGVHSEMKDLFHLRNPEMKARERPFYPQPTIFVGRHFDKAGNAAYDTLIPFLSLLGLDTKQGAEYSSRAIPEKVRERIDSQDIFLAIVTGNRNHAWLNAEPAYAKAKGKHIILLVQNGIRYNPTLLGSDLEQIRFDANRIEQSFVPLLLEFHNIGVRRV
jgi:hypothetical protein